MNTLAYWAFAYLPAPVLRRGITTGAFLRSLLRLVRTRRVTAQVLEGTRAGVPLRVLWVGDGPYREYLLPRLFPNGFAVLESADVSQAALPDRRGVLAGQCDLMAVERNRLLAPLAGFRRIPPGVRMGLSFRQRPPLGAKTRGKWDQARKRVAAAGVEFRDYLVRDVPEMLRRFYDELYAPHITAQFGLEHVESFGAMRAIYARGLLRLGFQGDTPIAGALYAIEGRTLVCCKSAVRDRDDPVHRAAGSIFLRLDYAEAQGYQAYDGFHARPFFEDGVFRHKRERCLDVRAERWAVYPGWDEDLFLRILRPAPGVLDFLRAEPHLRLCGDGSLAACLCPAADVEMVRAVIVEYERRRTPGIGRYEFLVPHAPSAQEDVALRDGCGQPATSMKFITFESLAGRGGA